MNINFLNPEKNSAMFIIYIYVSSIYSINRSTLILKTTTTLQNKLRIYLILIGPYGDNMSDRKCINAN